MFIELVDSLRCPHPHEESWLVAAAHRMEARHIVDGVLGCPVCRAEYPVQHGVVDFRSAASDAGVAHEPPNEGVALKLAALLDLTDASGFAVLTGGLGIHASLLHALALTPLIVVNPPTGVEGHPGVSVIRSDEGIPLATSSARGVAVDNASLIEHAMRVARSGARIVAPKSATWPPGVRALAEDETVRVGERESLASTPVRLHVRRR